MKRFSKIVVVSLMLITVISFSYQSSYGAYEIVPEQVNATNNLESEANVGVASLVVALVGGVYAIGYAIGRAVGHARYGSEELAINSVSNQRYDDKDFSSFDN